MSWVVGMAWSSHRAPGKQGGEEGAKRRVCGCAWGEQDLPSSVRIRPASLFSAPHRPGVHTLRPPPQPLSSTLLIPAPHLPGDPRGSPPQPIEGAYPWGGTAELSETLPPHPAPCLPGLRGAAGLSVQVAERATMRQGFETEKQRVRARRSQGSCPPPHQRPGFAAGAAETSPLPETRGQTDKHRWRERLSCFIYGPGDRPSPVSESLIYRAEEASHPLTTLFPPS